MKTRTQNGKSKQWNGNNGKMNKRQRLELRRQKRRETMQSKRADPKYRQQEQARNSAARKRARQNPEFRERERARNSAARRRAREDPEYRERERARDTAAHRRRREDPDFRQRERARESESRRLRRQKSRPIKTTIQKTIFLPTAEKEETPNPGFNPGVERRTRKIADLKGFFEVCLSEETTLTFC